MPEYADPPAPDALRELRQQIATLRGRVDRLYSDRSTTLSRGDEMAIPVPREGQVMINYDTNKPRYYAEGQWRDFGGGGPIQWARVSLEGGASDIVVGDDTEAQVTFNTYVESDPSMFSSTSTGNGIQVEQDGLYSIAAQAQWSVYDAGARHLYVIDPAIGFTGGGTGLPQSIWNSHTDDQQVTHGDMYLTAHQQLELWVMCEAIGAINPKLWGGASYTAPPDGHWLEVRYLGPVG